MKKTFINQQVKKHKKAFFYQSLLAGLMVFISLVAVGLTAPINDILSLVGICSLASSIFITFAFSASPASHPIRMISAYLLAIFLGMLFYYLSFILNYQFAHADNVMIFQIMAALALSLTMFFMVLFDIQHPPAAGLALGLVIESWRVTTLLIIIGMIVLISILKHLLRKKLISL